ncbi:MAG TPA: TolC family protein [Thermoanaerobaculia bacterium]|nr:TolC family protein [Thermoanaerobaculia bacterium]
MRKITSSFLILTAFAGTRLAAQGTPTQPKVLLLSLEDALRIASGESETVWVAEAGVTRAIGNLKTTRSTLFPQLSGSASYQRTLRSQFSGINFGGASQDQGLQSLPFFQLNQYSLGLSLSQLVFDGGQVLARSRASEARRRSAAIDVDAAKAQTLLDTTSAYFDALLADRLVEIAEASLSQQEELLRQTGVAQQVGEKSEFELLQSRVARDNQVPVVLQNRSQRQAAYWRLKQLLNVPLDDEIHLTTGIQDLPERFAKAADSGLEGQAPVRQAEENVQANRELLRSATRERWPSVSLSSFYNPVAYPASGVIPSIPDFRENWTVTLSLSVPILTGGRLAGDELTAKGNLSEAQARLKQTQEAAELDARVSRNDLADAEAILKSNQSTVEQGRRAYEIAQLRFREGLSSQIELQDSRLQFEQAEANQARALRNVQVARAKLALLRDLPLSGNSAAAAQAVSASAQTPAPAQSAQPAQPSTGGVTIPGISSPGGPP